MLMKHALKFKQQNKIMAILNKTFSAPAETIAKPESSSISLRFHELYIKELERIEKNS